MTKEELLKEVNVYIKSEVYYNNRIYRVGSKLKIKRYEFSAYTMVAIDKDGQALEDQPEKLNTAMVKEGLGEVKSSTKVVSFPILGEEEKLKEEAAKNKAIADAAAAAATTQVPAQTALGGGAASLV